MRTDWPRLLGDRRWTMVSNLPYNIATPLLLTMLEEGLPIDRYLVMVQREVGERLVAGPGAVGYGAVSVKVAYFCEAALVRRVSPSVFWPKPKVESVLVSLAPLAEPPVAVDRDELFGVVEEGFAQRRKTMANALRRLGLTSAAAAEAIEALGRPAGVRAEDLSLEELARLAEAVAHAA
jgi:16S rRNA (adenine1518-N6/adenine1519-N6)-dimethyltransferase